MLAIHNTSIPERFDMHTQPLRSLLLLLITAFAANTAGAAAANDTAMSSLAKSKNCLACHQAEKKLVGPGFAEIAQRYAKKSNTEETLAQKIRKGGAGVWGVVPMPANLQVNEDEALLLSKWILTK